MSEFHAGLEPEPLWRHFAMIAAIPRPSGREERVRAALAAHGRERGLEVREDEAGNLVLAVPASPGCEGSPVVVLQGHMDMVCEKNADVEHDFLAQGIKVVRDGEWLRAQGTTLGADNGVAIAAALALLDDPPGRHGPLELLFTVDEERGLTGARQVAPHMLKGRLLLNLDSEEEGFVTVGCAGGADTVATFTGPRADLPAGWETVRFEVKGLAGGHSGMDIVKNRANSLRCLGRLLDGTARAAGGLRVIELAGGSMRNAIPREASCLAGLPPGGPARAAAWAGELAGALRREFAATDPQLRLAAAAAPGASRRAFPADFSARLTAFLLAAPSGVLAMNRDIPGLPETSNNLGVAATEGDLVRLVCLTRSSLGEALEAARQGLRALGEVLGGKVELEPGYPGWQPDLGSGLLKRFQEVHREVAGREAQILAIHAGLECGILGERFPGMEMISFGPDLQAVHSPDERLNIPSTRRFFHLLKRVLEALA